MEPAQIFKNLYSKSHFVIFFFSFSQAMLRSQPQNFGGIMFSVVFISGVGRKIKKFTKVCGARTRHTK